MSRSSSNTLHCRRALVPRSSQAAPHLSLFLSRARLETVENGAWLSANHEPIPSLLPPRIIAPLLPLLTRRTSAPHPFDFLAQMPIVAPFLCSAAVMTIVGTSDSKADRRVGGEGVRKEESERQGVNGGLSGRIAGTIAGEWEGGQNDVCNVRRDDGGKQEWIE